jgi:hypothetical protein
MGVVDLLVNLGPADPDPTLRDLGGARAVQEELPEIAAHLVPDVIAAMAADLDSLEDVDELFLATSVRLGSDVLGPLSFARGADSLLRIAVARSNTRLTRALMDVFLEVVRTMQEDGPGALRRGHAIRAAVDLALLDVGASIHAPLATIERIDYVPTEMAPALTRAVGRLSEHSESEQLVRLLEDELAGHDNAAADALVELSLISMRAAFAAPDASGAEAGLHRAVVLLDRARRYDGDRPDARAYLGAARAVLAFSEDPSVLGDMLEDLLAAQRQLAMYSGLDAHEFRGAQPLRSSAAWLVLASELKAIRGHLDNPDLLDLRPGLEALAKAYGGVRLAVLGDERLGFTKFIRPVIVSRIEVQPGLPEAVQQLAARPDAPPGTQDLAEAMMRPKSRPRRTPRMKVGVQHGDRRQSVRLRPRRPRCW